MQSGVDSLKQRISELEAENVRLCILLKKPLILEKKSENSTRVGNGKEGIGLLQTGRKSYGRMNLLSLSCVGTEKTQSSAFKCSQT